MSGLSDADIWEIATLVNAAWSQAAQRVNAVMKERDDGSPDWAAFHAIRAQAALDEEAKANGLNFRYIAEHGPTIRKAMGL